MNDIELANNLIKNKSYQIKTFKRTRSYGILYHTISFVENKKNLMHSINVVSDRFKTFVFISIFFNYHENKTFNYLCDNFEFYMSQYILEEEFIKNDKTLYKKMLKRIFR